MRYVAVIGASASVRRRAPGPEWRCVHHGRTLTLWIPPDGEGYPIQEGYVVGATEHPATRLDEVTDQFGAYVAFEEAPSGRVSVLRDTAGRVPALQMAGRDGHVLFSRLEDVRWLAEPTLGIDWACLAALLLRNFMPARRTGLLGVTELLPGERADFEGGRCRTRLSWSPDAAWSRPYRRLVDARAELRAAAERSVAFWARRHPRILLDLSGGLDSSALLGLLARSATHPEITCVNAVVAHEESDERRYARAAAAMHRAVLHELDLSTAVADYANRPATPLQPRPTPQLRGAGLGVAALDLAREAGAQAYMTGRGGDHVFFEGLPTWSPADVWGVSFHPGRFAREVLNTARVTRTSVFAVLGDCLRPPRAARDLRSLMLSPNPFVADEAAAAVEVRDLAHPWLELALDGAPLAKVRQVCLLLELQRQYDRTGRAEALEEMHPFIAQPMFEAALRTPSSFFAADGIPRGLQRETFRELLPPEVLARRTKGATTSHSLRTLRANLPYLREHLLDGDLARSGLVDRARLEAALRPEVLLDGRTRPGLGECVIAQMWLEQARAYLGFRAGARGPSLAELA